MCNKHNSYQPIRCIIPPYISNALMDSDDKQVADKAVNSTLQEAMLRMSRKFVGGLEPAQRKTMMAAPPRRTKPQMNMQLYDIHHNTDVAGATLLWADGTAIKRLDKDAKNIVACGTAAWDFFYKIFGRNSLDNLGMIMKHYIHYGNSVDDMNNAMWDGLQMVYGDGDAKTFGSFTSDPDIIAHELTHAITQYECNLDYHNQSGALNESLSDVFGIMVKQRMMNLDVKKSNWQIGENVLLGNKYCLRSMSEPGSAFKKHPDLGDDPQPATMDKYLKLPDTGRGDWGGVHYNSGITNYAFYVAAYNMGGFSWEKIGRVWYAAMTDKKKLKPTANFADFKALTITKAETLFGIKSKAAAAVKSGWNAAKV